MGQTQHFRYTAQIGPNTYSFPGVEFIQGVSTASLWIGTTIPITDLRDNDTPISF